MHENNVRVRSNQQQQSIEDTLQPTHDDYDVSVAGSDFSDLSVSEDESPDDLVPSRTFLKLSSQRQYNETMRKQEQDNRRRAQLEKMRDENGELDASLASLRFRKKQQEAANRRLAEVPHNTIKTGLPAGVTVRDDAMTKTYAFLTQQPQLE